MHDLLIGIDCEGRSCGLLEGTVSEFGYENIDKVRKCRRESQRVKGRLYLSIFLGPLYLKVIKCLPFSFVTSIHVCI